jgi:hypothetical protein
LFKLVGTSDFISRIDFSTKTMIAIVFLVVERTNKKWMVGSMLARAREGRLSITYRIAKGFSGR